MKNALIAIQVISAIVMIIAILLQPSKGNGIQGLVSGTSDTFYSKNKTKTKEAFLMKLTIFSAVVFVVSITLINMNL
ncbi:MAG: preprotein translocase subunit SecG [Clostridium argentinense]|uniref:Protein-export membrane protein SecG n=1 Tax=Clostridium faecium TaxID=2762223 RepID=A0ABR8YWL1_9CLOT|nr:MULTISPECIES: preprotein translocase subunit SecG [Clostridium]MBD8048219.1 preprotein translocase subunit SecG [Clostridium faecium]MBS5824343.1 preprotein translocase subunit SecG [Clostridium argentinense]MDU1349046.1 preprotein translocase subunit SecG [Clostridium argentinense]